MADSEVRERLYSIPRWHLRAGSYGEFPDEDLFLPEEATVAVELETRLVVVRLFGVELECRTRCSCGRHTWTVKGKRGRPRRNHEPCRYLMSAWSLFQDAFIDATERGLYGSDEVPMGSEERNRWRKRLWNLANAANVESDKRELVPEV